MGDARAQVDEENEDGLTPLILAGDKGVLAIVEALLAARANIAASAEGWGSAVDAAQAAGHNEVAALLQSVGACSAETRTDGSRKVAAGEKWGYDAFDGEEDY